MKMTPLATIAIQNDVLNEKLHSMRAQDVRRLWRPAAFICAAVGMTSGIISLLFSAQTYALHRSNDKSRSIMNPGWDKTPEPLTPLEDALRASAARYARDKAKTVPNMVFLHGLNTVQVVDGVMMPVFNIQGMAGKNTAWFLLRNLHEMLSGYPNMTELQREAARAAPANFNYLKDPDNIAAIDYLVAHEFEHIERRDARRDNLPALTKALMTSTATSGMTTLIAGASLLVDHAQTAPLKLPKNMGFDTYYLMTTLVEKMTELNIPVAPALLGLKGFLPYVISTVVSSAGLLGAVLLADRAKASVYNMEVATDIGAAKRIGLDNTITALFVYGGAEYALAKTLWRGIRAETNSEKRMRGATMLIDTVSSANAIAKDTFKTKNGFDWPQGQISDGDRLVEMLTLYREAALRPARVTRVQPQPQPPI